MNFYQWDMLSRRKNHWKVFAGTARFKKCVRCSLGDCCRLLFSCSVVSSPLRPHGLQHIRLPCPSLSPGVCSNSCPLSWWCRPTISSSVVPFSCLQSFSASGSFLMNWLFASGSQSIGGSASASVLPVNYSGLISFRIDWFDLLAVQGALKSLL